MKLFFNERAYQQKENNKYQQQAEITSAEELQRVACYDHVAAEYKNNHRHNDNFINSDCLIMDVDNDHTDDPAQWVTTADIAADLPGVEFYAATSRNHGKEKKSGDKTYTARPRFHVYFPIDKTTSAAEYADMKERLVNMFAYYDSNAKDVARFLYGNADVKASHTDGNRRIDQFLQTMPKATQWSYQRTEYRQESEGLDVLDALRSIDPAALSYAEWLSVGMALKSGGYDMSDFDAWSRADSRYKPREIPKKWASFKRDGVGVGTIIYMAQANGWKPEPPQIVTVTKSTPAPAPAQASEQTPTDQTQPQEQKPPRPTFEVYNASDYLNGGGYSGDIAYFKAYKDRKTGFKQLDEYLTLYPGLACVGGASSLGKTTFAVNILDRLLSKGETVLYFSLEQLPIEIMTKSLARMMYERDPFTKLTNTQIKNGATSAELDAIKKEYAQLSKNLQIIRGSFQTTAADIVQYVEQYRAQHNGIKPIVIIDYLQLIAPPIGNNKGIREYTDENIKALKKMQLDNELFVIMVSNFNRSSNLEPVSYESFKETSMIEYTCDYIWGLQLTIQDERNSDFYTVTGTQGGRKERTIDSKRQLITKELAAPIRQVELVSLKNRNGKQRFTCFFDYNPALDAYAEAKPPAFLKNYDAKDFK